VTTALTAGQGLLRILADILDISQIEAGRMSLAEGRCDRDGIVRPVLAAFAPEAEKKGLALACDVAPDIPAVFRGDAGRIRQVLYNLVGNAIKYTETGSVRLSITRFQATGSRAGAALCFDISDTGIGIPADKQARMFEVFTQADGSYTRKYGGSGLGLSIVARLVDLMGGTVFLCSEENRAPGSGSCCPGIEVDAAEPGRRAASEAVPGRVPAPGGRILVVEDDPGEPAHGRKNPVQARLRPRQRRGRQTALEVLRREEFDLILMDIQLPVMGGPGRDQDHPGRYGLPEKGLHPHHRHDRPRHVRGPGDVSGLRINGYIAKPWTCPELRQVIEQGHPCPTAGDIRQ
jgi:hypothetical protein